MYNEFSTSFNKFFFFFKNFFFKVPCSQKNKFYIFFYKTWILINWNFSTRGIFILFVLPWLDTSKVRSAIFRPIYRQFFWILVIDVLMLGYVGAMPAEGVYLVLARVGTIYYFAHFLIILPVLGLKEKTLPLPLNITEPILGGSPNLAAAKAKEEKIN